jgi:Ca-activated chloride channel family protein
MFTNYSFQEPWFFLLLLLLPIAGFYHYKRQKTYYPGLRIPTIRAIYQIRSWKALLQPMLAILRTLSFGFIVIALARPQQTLKIENIRGEGIDIFMVVDLSSSMLAKDFEPDRLEACKKVATEFVDQRPYDRIGLAVFAGEAFTQCPLTTDRFVVKELLAGLKCGYLEDGTAIGMGLATAVNRMKDSPSKSKVIVLLTDGVNNAGYVKPLTAADIAKEYSVKVYTIGVGTEAEALTPVSRRSDGEYVFGLAPVEIDESLMQQIAEMTGGKYFRATNEAALKQIYDEINRLEKTEIEITSMRRYSEEFHKVLLWALIFLALEVVLRYSLLKTIP